MSSNQAYQRIYYRVSKGSLTEEVVSQIEELILSGELQTGDKLLSQRDLAVELGVSPTVIREAVKVLEQKGLVETRAGSGTYVSALTPEACSEVLTLLFRHGKMSFSHLHEARRTLEIEIAGLAAARAQLHHIEQMEDAILRMDQGLDNPDEYIRADFDFHLTLARAAQNPVFPLLTITLLEVLQESRRLNFEVAGAPSRGQLYHRAICDCVKQGDVEGARAEMREHLEQVSADNEAGRALKHSTSHGSPSPLFR